MIREIDSNANIKKYLTRIEPVVKEITLKDKDEYYIILKRLEEIKEKINIYEIIEGKNKLYIVIDNKEEILSKIDKLILSNELDIEKEIIVQGHGKPIKKEEINELFKFEKSMCKITSENLEGNKGNGTGFFCEIDNFPIKYALFTNNHVLNELNIEIGKTINFEYLENTAYVKKKIKIKENRKVFTNNELDYTCIELLESDNIKNYFEIEPNLFKYDKSFLKNNDIFILQYPNGNDISFSYGKILSIKDNIINHNSSTEKGSSGSPIIRRCNEDYIIGLHFGGYKNNEYNLAITFDSILNNIKEQINKGAKGGKNLGKSNENNDIDNNLIEFNKKFNLNIKSNITKLDLSYKSIECINYLENLTFKELKELYLYNSGISDIGFLEKVKFDKLEKLNLARNIISNITILEKVNFKELKELYLHLY